MSLSPIDIRHQEFKKVFRGFDPVEVEQYLNCVADEMEKVLQESEKLRRDLRENIAKLESYTKVEEAISQTLVDTRKTAEKKVENARQEAELIIKRAQADAEEILRKANERTVKIRQDLYKLEDRKKMFRSRLRSILDAHLRLLEDSEENEISKPGAEPRRSKLTDADIDRIAEGYE
jgi:cell division initiation protein